MWTSSQHLLRSQRPTRRVVNRLRTVSWIYDNSLLQLFDHLDAACCLPVLLALVERPHSNCNFHTISHVRSISAQTKSFCFRYQIKQFHQPGRTDEGSNQSAGRHWVCSHAYCKHVTKTASCSIVSRLQFIVHANSTMERTHAVEVISTCNESSDEQQGREITAQGVFYRRSQSHERWRFWNNTYWQKMMTQAVLLSKYSLRSKHLVCSMHIRFCRHCFVLECMDVLLGLVKPWTCFVTAAFDPRCCRIGSFRLPEQQYLKWEKLWNQDVRLWKWC